MLAYDDILVARFVYLKHSDSGVSHWKVGIGYAPHNKPNG